MIKKRITNSASIYSKREFGFKEGTYSLVLWGVKIMVSNKKQIWISNALNLTATVITFSLNTEYHCENKNN